MKQIWTMPRATVEKFTANEYVAACGDSGTVYKFKCDAPGGMLYYHSQSDGVVDGKHEGTGRATQLGNYHPCGESHRANATDGFYDGFVDYNGNHMQDEGEGVIVWIEFGRHGQIRDAHATTNLDMNSWETAKS